MKLNLSGSRIWIQDVKDLRTGHLNALSRQLLRTPFHVQVLWTFDHWQRNHILDFKQVQVMLQNREWKFSFYTNLSSTTTKANMTFLTLFISSNPYIYKIKIMLIPDICFFKTGHFDEQSTSCTSAWIPQITRKIKACCLKLSDEKTQTMHF